MGKLYKKIGEIREQKGITKAELARRLGVSRQCVGQLEKSEHNPQSGRLEKIALALGVEVVEFFEPPKRGPKVKKRLYKKRFIQ